MRRMNLLHQMRFWLSLSSSVPYTPCLCNLKRSKTNFNMMTPSTGCFIDLHHGRFIDSTTHTHVLKNIFFRLTREIEEV